jgi:large subunit ribosomal protein L30
MLRIKLVKSPIGNNLRNRRTVQALGLRKVHQVVEQPDNSSIRGMIHHVQHMVTFEVVEGDVAPKTGAKAMKASAPKVAKAVTSKSKPAVAPKPKKAEASDKPAEAKPKKAAAKKPEAKKPEAKKAAPKKKTEEKA